MNASFEPLHPEIRDRINPRGVIVEWLPGPYIGFLPLIRGSSKLWPVRWYKTDCNRVLTVPTIFTAREYYDDGEDLVHAGCPREPINYLDQFPCAPPTCVPLGTAEEYMLGVVMDEPPDPGILACDVDDEGMDAGDDFELWWN